MVLKFGAGRGFGHSNRRSQGAGGGNPFATILSASFRIGGSAYRRNMDGRNAGGSAQAVNILTTADSANPSAFPTALSAWRVSATQDTAIVVFGDSQSLTFGAESYIAKMARKAWNLAGKKFDIINRAVVGQGWTYDYTGGTVPAINADAAAVLAGIVAAYIKVIVVAFAGTNDLALGGQSPATAATNAQTFCTTCTSAGVSAGNIYIIPMMPRGTGGGQYSEANRSTYNASLSSMCSSNGYVFVTPSASIYNNGAQSTATYQADNTHLSDSGCQVLCNDLYGVIAL